MDYRNAITSVEHFQSALKDLLHRARKNLERDDWLAETALLYGSSTCRQLLIIGVTAEQTNAHLKNEVRNGNYETVIFIALAAVHGNVGKEGDTPIYRGTGKMKEMASIGDARLAVLVEGTHRDFGAYAAHVEFKREGAGRFVFLTTACGPLKGGVVGDLWPKRTLNS